MCIIIKVSYPVKHKFEHANRSIGIFIFIILSKFQRSPIFQNFKNLNYSGEEIPHRNVRYIQQTHQKIYSFRFYSSIRHSKNIILCVVLSDWNVYGYRVTIFIPHRYYVGYVHNFFPIGKILSITNKNL